MRVLTLTPDWNIKFVLRLPKGRFIMAFAEDKNPEQDSENFTDYFPGLRVKSCKAYDTAEAFIKAWEEVVDSKDPDVGGMWYWCLDIGGEPTCFDIVGRQFCSGACAPEDIEIFEEYPPLSETARKSQWFKSLCE